MNNPVHQTPSPNFDDRPENGIIDMLILHYTGMKTGEEALQRMCDPKAEVSAHYMVEEDGRIFQLVDENKRAWHAGVAFWRGERAINARSIGIEIVNPGHEWGYRRFPDVQIEAVISLCHDILARHPIPARNVVGHSDVAPTRKTDPGELFPWQKLAEHQIGLWPGKEMSPITLQDFGYEDDSAESILAFQRHFLPNQLSGKLDEPTQSVLNQLGACL